MSQRTFRYKGYSVFTGWDRPLQYHFLTIENKQGETVYTNLDDPAALTGISRFAKGLTIEQVLAHLSRFGIVYPVTLPKDLREDEEQDRGEFLYNYDDHPHEHKSNLICWLLGSFHSFLRRLSLGRRGNRTD